MSKHLGYFILVSMLCVAFTMFSYTSFLINEIESTKTYPERSFIIEGESIIQDKNIVFNDVQTENKEAKSSRRNSRNSKVESINGDITSRSTVESVVEDIVPDVIQEIVSEVIEDEPVSRESRYNNIEDVYYSSNISVKSGEQYSEYGTNLYGTPYLQGDKFAVYSPQMGLVDSKRMEVIHNFTETASNWFDNPLGADTYGVLRNSQIEIKRRLVMQSGETDHFKFIYTIRNIGGPWFRDKTKFDDFKIDKKLPVPAFADLDDDGDLDMAIGEQSGRLYYYKNIGDNENFNFIPGDNIFSNVKVYLNVGNVWNYKAAPSFADLDGDSDYDLILGNSQNYLGYYENTGTASNPLWTETDMFGFLNDTTVYDSSFADLDNDNDLDMIIANLNEIIYYENTGTINNPVWTWSFSDNFSIDQSVFLNIEITDIDDDGDSDILVGGKIPHNNKKQVYFIENIGNANSPDFKHTENFSIDNGETLRFEDMNANSNNGIGVGDLDGDGREDLVTGNDDGTLTFYKRSDGSTVDDLYFYEIPLIDFDRDEYNGTLSYDPATDSFTATWNPPTWQEASLTIYGDRPSSKHGIHQIDWYYPSRWEYDEMGSSHAYDNSEDRYWTDGELNGLSDYDILAAAGIDYDLSGDMTNTKYQVSPVLGFYLGDLDAGEEETVIITYKSSFGSGSRNYAELSVEDIKFNSGNVEFMVVNDGDLSAADVTARLVETYKGKLIDTTDVNIGSVRERTRENISVGFDVEKKHKVTVIVDPDGKIIEDDENNNMAEQTRKKYDVYVDVDTGNLSSLFEEYIKSKLVDYNIVDDVNSDYRLYVGGLSLNDETLEKGFGIDGYVKFYSKKGFYPYSGFVNVMGNNVFVRGVNTDGVVAALKHVSWESLKNNKHYVSDDDIKGLEVFDFFRLPENSDNLYKDNAEFEGIVREALFGKYVEENKSIKTLQGVELRLRHLGSKYSSMLKQYLNLPAYPVVMAGGLWSDINTWQELGQELSDSGRDVWLAEITGGPGTESDVAADYTYQDLIDYHIPAIVGGVVTYTGEDRIQWVGHSNGGRSALDFLSAYSGTGLSPSGLYFDGIDWNYSSFGTDVVETYVGVGVPGAFEGLSFFSQKLNESGEQAIDEFINEGKYHVSFTDVKNKIWNIPFIGGDNKISLNLFDQYYKWINSTLDVQPAVGLSIDRFAIVGGYEGFGSDNTNDYIVPLFDENSIYSNINSPNKFYFTDKIRHNGMAEKKLVKDITKNILNKMSFDNINSCSYLEISTNSSAIGCN